LKKKKWSEHESKEFELRHLFPCFGHFKGANQLQFDRIGRKVFDAEKTSSKTSVTKSSRCQFHQHFMHAFLAPKKFKPIQNAAL